MLKDEVVKKELNNEKSHSLFHDKEEKRLLVKILKITNLHGL